VAKVYPVDGERFPALATAESSTPAETEAEDSTRAARERAVQA